MVVKRGTLCGAKKRNGERCAREAGWGTAHKGTGACKLHGGSVPQHARSNCAPQLELLVGHTVDVDPFEALLMCVRITAGEVAYFSQRISQLEEGQLIVRPRKETALPAGRGFGSDVVDMKQQKQLNLWIRVRQESMDRLARYAKMAVDAGIDERLVKVAEQVGDKLAQAIEAIMNDLQLSSDQMAKAPQLIRKHLYALEGAS